MYKKQFIFLMQAILFLLIVNLPLGFAETVVLKSGKQIEGKIIDKSNQYVRIEVEGVPITFWFDEIERIEGIEPIPGQKVIPKPSPEITPELSLDRVIVEKYIAEVNQSYLNGKYEDALVSLNKAIRLDPNNADLYVATGILHYYLGHSEEAISSLQNAYALAFEPNKVEIYLYLGIIYDSIGLQEKAKEILIKSIEQFKEKVDITGILIAEALLKKISQK